jgi:FkbM family methyltransferase
MKILYGIQAINIDVTYICYNKLKYNNIIKIPSDERNRSRLFTDPIYGTLKQIFIIHDDNSISEYNDTLSINIDVNTNIITSVNIDALTQNIQNNMQIKYGHFSEELPEQKMAVRYLTGQEKVLEIGGNIGRNSLIIGYILAQNNNDSNFVSLECDANTANQLRENRDLNNLHFHIEPTALSKRKLIQRGWDTIASDTILEGYQHVDTITLPNLESKYNITFDTLVLDCEGAFYFILMDMPEILNNINLIIMENDYLDITKKQYVDSILTNHNFYVEYVERGGWGPCYNNFFEVWKRKNDK